MFGNRLAIYQSSGARGLSDVKAAVGAHLRDGVAHFEKRGHLLPVSQVPATGLGSAFQDVTCHQGGGESIPIPWAPAELKQRRRDDHSRVDDTAGNDHLSSLLQGPGYRMGTQIGIGTLHPIPDLGKILLGV